MCAAITYLMVLTYYCTKWPAVYALKEKTAEAAIERLKNTVGRYGADNARSTQ